MSENKEYRIETVSDFTKLPLDRVDDCMKEFIPSLKRAIATLEGCKKIASALGMEKHMPLIQFEGFTWIDDGKTEVVSNIKITAVSP